MQCKGCHTDCPFVVPEDCPVRNLLIKRINQMTKGLNQLDNEPAGTIMVLNNTSFGRN